MGEAVVTPFTDEGLRHYLSLGTQHATCTPPALQMPLVFIIVLLRALLASLLPSCPLSSFSRTLWEESLYMSDQLSSATAISHYPVYS